MALQFLFPAISRPGRSAATNRRAVVVAVLLGAATSTACSGTKVEPLATGGAPATVTTSASAATSAPTTTKPTSPSTNSGAGSGTTAPSGATTPTSSRESVASTLPAPTGGRLFSDPEEEIRLELGQQFAVSLPAPTKAKAWTFNEKGCINVKVLGVKTQSTGRVTYALLWDVAGACYLDFFDADSPDFEAKADLRFNAKDADL